ncbi:GDP-mannose 4,6-dehydratase [Mesorhizobium sp. M0933]|uniref:GDP-mannose 4,6-dehydratase n=1 Tax=Mesorhizobium sp. M0933 TaxID=2957030 RepID=UPI00333A8923
MLQAHGCRDSERDGGLRFSRSAALSRLPSGESIRRYRLGGGGVDEAGRKRRDNQTLIRIDKRYFRPTEVDLLIGDASKAATKLVRSQRPFSMGSSQKWLRPIAAYEIALDYMKRYRARLYEKIMTSDRRGTPSIRLCPWPNRSPSRCLTSSAPILPASQLTRCDKTG